MPEQVPPSKSVMRRVSQQAYGKLKDHTSVCDECGGKDPGEDEDPCWRCDGDKEVGWPSWYASDFSQCDECGHDGPIQEDMDNGGYYCLQCLVKSHKKHCGCDLWKKVEEALGL